ncbi:MAG: hypothetical protein MZU95_16325 [Desulfomicrobium escambiense]|nr:hypothetical protein [Desulfomicrobium escambiense]
MSGTAELTLAQGQRTAAGDGRRREHGHTQPQSGLDGALHTPSPPASQASRSNGAPD